MVQQCRKAPRERAHNVVVEMVVVEMEDHDIRGMRARSGGFEEIPPDPLDVDMAISRLEARVARLEGQTQILISLSIAQVTAIIALAVELMVHAV